MVRYDIHVIPQSGQWAVIREGDDDPVSVHATREDAESIGRQLATDGSVRFTVHPGDARDDPGEDGDDVYGEDPRASGTDEAARGGRMEWEHRVEVFGMEWRRNERLPDAEGLQRKLNEWGKAGWELVAFEVAHDEAIAAEGSGAAGPSAVYLAILKRPGQSGSG